MKRASLIFRKETSKILKVFLHPTFLYLTVLGNSLLIVATAVVYHLEKANPNAQIKTYFDSLWWGISTITTVAYGDLLPQTFGGRLIGILLMYTGTVLFISFTGVLLSILMREEVEKEIIPLEREVRREEKGQIHIEKTLSDIAKRLESVELQLKGRVKNPGTKE